MILNEIIQAICPLQVVGCTNDLQLDIRHLLTDSRQIGNEPEETLFFALKTDKNDGAKYIPQLIKRGVRTFVVTQNQYSYISGIEDWNTIILVEDVLAALQQLAIYKRSLYNGPVIGITGSNGKTVVKE